MACRTLLIDLIMKLSLFTFYLLWFGHPSEIQTSVQATSVMGHPVEIECTTSCPWDFDGSGFVNIDDDLLTILSQYGTATTEGCDVGDFDENGSVDINDFRGFLSHLSSPCE